MEKHVIQSVLGCSYIPSLDTHWDAAIQDYLTDVLSRCKPKTAQFYADQLTLLARWSVAQKVDVREFAARHIRLYLVERGSKVSETTRHSDAVAAKAFFGFCAREGYVANNPLRDYKIKRAPRPFRYCPCQEEIEHLVASLYVRWLPELNPMIRNLPPKRRAFFAARNLAIIAGLIDTAARPGELLGLTMADYFPRAREITIRQTKTDEARTVPTTEDWIELISGRWGWLGVRPKKADCERLFITENGDPITVDHMGQLFREHLQWAEMPWITLHTLRHYAGSDKARKDFWAAVHIMGHRDPRTTLIYLHAKAGQMRAAQDAANTLGNILQNKSTERARRRRII